MQNKKNTERRQDTLELQKYRRISEFLAEDQTIEIYETEIGSSAVPPKQMVGGLVTDDGVLDNQSCKRTLILKKTCACGAEHRVVDHYIKHHGRVAGYYWTCDVCSSGLFRSFAHRK